MSTLDRLPALPVEAHGPRVSLERAALAVFVFSAFFPNPAIPVGSSSGIQFNQIMAVAVLWLARRNPIDQRFWTVLFLIYGPIVIGASVVTWRGDAMFADLAIKNIVLSALPLLVLTAGGAAFKRDNMRLILGAACAGIIVNGLIGAWQWWSFAGANFPLMSLFNNPEFASFTDVADDYAEYVKRPFGLFPEPSAMSASVGPFVILLLSLVWVGARGVSATTGDRALWGLAALMGGALLVASASGYALLLPLFAIGGYVFGRWTRRPTAAGTSIGCLPMALIVASTLGVLLAALPIMILRVTTEMGLEAGSWVQRARSIQIGFLEFVSSADRVLFGIGPGVSHKVVSSQDSSLEAIYSTLLRYIFETGIVGAMALAIVTIGLLRIIRASELPGLGAAVAISIAAGATMSTSYWSLAPMWMMLALVVKWDQLFPAASGFQAARNVAASSTA